MAALTTNAVPHAGLRIDDKFVPAAAGGDDCASGAGVVLLVKNGDTAAHTVTLVTPSTVDGDLAVTDRTVSVPANGQAAIPVLDLYRNPSTGRANVTYDAAPPTLTVAVIRVAAS